MQIFAEFIYTMNFIYNFVDVKFKLSLPYETCSYKMNDKLSGN